MIFFASSLTNIHQRAQRDESLPWYCQTLPVDSDAECSGFRGVMVAVAISVTKVVQIDLSEKEVHCVGFAQGAKNLKAITDVSAYHGTNEIM
jgi:hypothetical protein